MSATTSVVLRGSLVFCALVALSACENDTPEPAPSGEWTETRDGIDCTHPGVQKDCSDGWCRIPAGCFIMGSPETEPSRGLYTEPLTAVTLSRPFEIAQTELTRAQWLQHVATDPTEDGDDIKACDEPNCPVFFVSWYEALAFANLLSKAHKPALAECFSLQGCSGALGASLECTGVKVNAPSLFECEGYRLPSEAEWEYAARAGTRTAHYNGDLLHEDPSLPDAKVDAIAWYAMNSGRSSHPVKQKLANGFGVYDMLGNGLEWVHDGMTSPDPPGPWVDPLVESSELTVLRGSRANSYPHTMRVAGRGGAFANDRGQGVGFRLARTLFE